MTDIKLYALKEEVYFEPLFNSWYAWPYLIPPVQSARYTVATHLRLMKSFVQNHHIHIAASKQLVGGEFLYSKEEDLSEIRKIIDNTETYHGDIIDLSKALVELNDLLRAHKSGETVEHLYSKIPGPLKGYVELFMDLEHNASYRIFESLIYKSSLYKEELQSVSFGIISKVDERPFILSTPRTADDKHLLVNMRFNSADLKKLLATRDNPLPMAEIDAIFDKHECKGGLDYRELFSSSAPSHKYEKTTNELRIQYTGHAGFLVETPDSAVMIDPVIATRDERSSLYMIGYNELPEKIDFICLTHSHQDHVSLETLLQLRHKTDRVLVPKNNGGSLCDPSLKLMLQQLDFQVTEFEDLESVNISGGHITSIPFLGEHGDLNIRSKTAWLIELAGKKLFFGADSSCLDKNMYTHIHNIIGDVDLLAIGMECIGAPYTWLYGALYDKKVSKNIKDSRRLNGADSEQAEAIAKIFNPKQLYIYALGFEPCYKYFMGIEYEEDSTQIVESNKMLEVCRDLGIRAKKLIGSQTIELP